MSGQTMTYIGRRQPHIAGRIVSLVLCAAVFMGAPLPALAYVTVGSGAVINTITISYDTESGDDTGGGDDTDSREAPFVDKLVSSEEETGYALSNSVYVGDTVYYRVYLYTAAGTSNYVLHLYMTGGLTFNSGSVTVSVGGTVLTEGVDYLIVYADSAGDTCTFEIIFLGTWLAAYDASTPVLISYSMTANAAAVAGAYEYGYVVLDYYDAETMTYDPVDWAAVIASGRYDAATETLILAKAADGSGDTGGTGEGGDAGSGDDADGGDDADSSEDTGGDTDGGSAGGGSSGEDDSDGGSGSSGKDTSSSSASTASGSVTSSDSSSSDESTGSGAADSAGAASDSSTSSDESTGDGAADSAGTASDGSTSDTGADRGTAEEGAPAEGQAAVHRAGSSSTGGGIALTGDESPLTFWLITAAASSAALVYVLAVPRRRRTVLCGRGTAAPGRFRCSHRSQLIGSPERTGNTGNGQAARADRYAAEWSDDDWWDEF